MHKVTENKVNTPQLLVAVAEAEYEKAREKLSKATAFQYLPLDEQVLYLLHEPAMADFDDEQLAEVLAIMKSGNWRELANLATGVYAQSMSYDADTGTLSFHMRQNDEPDAGRFTTVSFTLAADAGVVKVSVPAAPEDSADEGKLPSGYELAKARQVGERVLGEWSSKADELSRLSDEIRTLLSGAPVPQETASAPLLDRVKSKMDAYETRERKWGFGTKTEHVTRSYEEACAVVAAEGDRGAGELADEYRAAVAEWMPIVQARRERVERDQAASRAFSEVARSLVDKGWQLVTPDMIPGSTEA